MRVWNVSTSVWERTLEGHTNYVEDMILLLDAKICSASNDSSDKLWNKETGVRDLCMFVCHNSLIQISYMMVNYLLLPVQTSFTSLDDIASTVCWITLSSSICNKYDYFFNACIFREINSANFLNFVLYFDYSI
jgi:WD40 repeat protein